MDRTVVLSELAIAAPTGAASTRLLSAVALERQSIAAPRLFLGRAAKLTDFP
jgi:hypothetical protein